MKKVFVTLMMLAMISFGSVATMAQGENAVSTEQVGATQTVQTPNEVASSAPEVKQQTSSSNTENTAQQPATQKNNWSFWSMMILIFVVFYFFMIRPQQKKQKELQKQREALKKGDKVITAGGIYGNIKEVQETTFLIEVSKDVVIKVDKGSVYVSVEDTKQEEKK